VVSPRVRSPYVTTHLVSGQLLYIIKSYPLRRDSPVQTSTDRILTTHTGSIARPDDLIELMRAKENGRPYDTGAFEAQAKAAVEECVRRQVEAGLDVINDGEQRKSGFTTYLTERLAGFDAVPYGPGESPGSWGGGPGS